MSTYNRTQTYNSLNNAANTTPDMLATAAQLNMQINPNNQQIGKSPIINQFSENNNVKAQRIQINMKNNRFQHCKSIHV
jgi:hypothetical protein